MAAWRHGHGHPLDYVRHVLLLRLPFNVLGIIFSLVALAQIRNDPHFQQGRPLAIAGLVLSLLSIVLAALC